MTINKFNDYKAEILRLANTEAGRWLLGVKNKEQVVRVFPNGFTFKVGKKLTWRFFCYDRVAKIFIPPIDKMSIYGERSKKIFNHFSGVEENHRKYPQIYLSTATFYAGAGDGYVVNDVSDTWANAHAASSGTTADYTTAGVILCGATRYASGDTAWDISRSFFPIDTSALADTATISSATFNIYVNESTNQDNDGNDWFNVVQTSQADTNAVVTADFDQCGSVSNPTEGATRIDQGSITTSAYNTWTLDSTGMGWIDKAGITKLGLRSGHDALNDPLTWGGAQTRNRIRINASESTSTTTDPYLEVITADENAGLIFISV